MPNNDHNDIEITIVDFQSCGWRSAFSSATQNDIHSISFALREASISKVATNNNHAQVLKLLADCCSMILCPNDIRSPFKPLIECGNQGRSAIPEDFSNNELIFLSSILDEIDIPSIRARVADICWLQIKPKDVHHLNCAVDAYLEIARNSLAYEMEIRDGLLRALYLCKAAKLERELQSIQDLCIDVALSSNVENCINNYCGLFDLIERFNLPDETLKYLFNHGKELMLEIEAKNDHWSLISILEVNEKISSKIGLHNEKIDSLVRMANVFVTMAEDTNRVDKSHLSGFINYDKAINTYLRIPRKEREQKGLESDLDKLKSKKYIAYSNIRGEMFPISSGPIDLTEDIKVTQKRISGKCLDHAMRSYLALYSCHEGKLHDLTVRHINEFPLTSVFQTSVLSDDGRIIAKSLPRTDHDDQIVQMEMIKLYRLHVELIVQVLILPGLRVIMNEHHIDIEDVRGMVDRSARVPKDRRELFTQGLYYGFKEEFSTALHILVPQIENIVRTQLKLNQISTTRIEAGIEHEMGLNNLVGRQEIKDIFGRDFAYELDALLCHPNGYNVRNVVAHGLVNDDGASSSFSVYTWWFTLKLILGDMVQ